MRKISESSLIAFRILFGLLLFFSTIRFILKGWINDFYVVPKFHFTYQYFEWIKPLVPDSMYVLFYLLVVLSLFISLGLLYRLSIILFFLGFTYIELIDKTFYLNHYYAVSLICFLMIFFPLNQRFSIDSILFKDVYKEKIEAYYIYIFRFQVSLIYFFAGIAKINYDWLILAQPLKIWLKAEQHIPIIGNLLTQNFTAYLMSWVGMIYDLSIPFLLLNKRTRKLGFISVIIFHVLTWWLFNIGVFPWVMIILATVFFEPEWFEPFINKISYLTRNIHIFHKEKKINTFGLEDEKKFYYISSTTIKKQLKKVSSKLTITNKIKASILGIYFLIQAILPLRHYFYQGNFFWTEQGFRFAWHVMIIEKTGMTEFIVKDIDSGKQWNVSPREYLTPLQEKMMSTQADMILQFAHYLGDIYKKKGHKNLEIYAESYVALNGRSSKQFIKPDVNLLKYNLDNNVTDYLESLE